MPRHLTGGVQRRRAGVRLPAGPGLAWALVLALALVSCGVRPGKRIGNLPPHVRLTGGPVQGDSVSYTAEFFWTGWDEDGIIDHYQYAIDIPDSLLGGLDGAADPRIAWVDTTAFRASFLFTTPVQDTILLADGTTELPERYRGNHTLHVRSVDNEGLESPSDFLSFTARTITPRTTLTLPKVAATSQILIVGRQFSMAWEGLDPDAASVSKKPVFYEWKLVPVENILLVSDPGFALRVIGANIPWNRVGADTTFIRLILNPPQDYVVGVRGIDVAGGVEDHFSWGQNALRLSAMSGGAGTPVLTVKEPTLGEATFPGSGDLVEFEVPVNYCLRFDLFSDTDAYGGTLQGYNWGVDVPDIEAEGPNSGFQGWTLIPYTFPPICFSTPGVHSITIKCRDTGGGLTVGTLIVRVIGSPRDREVLYVDDYQLSRLGVISDSFMDQRAREMLLAAGYGEVFQLDTFGDDDGNVEPRMLKLSEMTRYKLLVWSVAGSGYGGKTALLYMNACPRNHLLQAYVGSGGAVWIYGQQLFATMKSASADQCIATMNYNFKVGLDMGASTFPCMYLHLCGGDIRDVKEESKRDGMVRALPTAEAVAELFPPVGIDSTVFSVINQGGIPLVDAMFTPTYDGSGGLDTLYVMEPAKPTSVFRNKPTAFRYWNPDPGSRQGPVALFGFPFHLLKQGSAADRTGVKGMARSMIDWFRSHGG